MANYKKYCLDLNNYHLITTLIILNKTCNSLLNKYIKKIYDKSSKSIFQM